MVDLMRLDDLKEISDDCNNYGFRINNNRPECPGSLEGCARSHSRTLRDGAALFPYRGPRCGVLWGTFP
jgi:hypothetical protein